MTKTEKLNEILSAVQTDPGNRGLAKDRDDNLFSACRDDFASACRHLSKYQVLFTYTGFPIIREGVAQFETDGPLGAYFLRRAFIGESDPWIPGIQAEFIIEDIFDTIDEKLNLAPQRSDSPRSRPYTVLAIERAGPAQDGNCYSMRGKVLNSSLDEAVNQRYIDAADNSGRRLPRIAIGDGGNELGMGRIPHETIVRNIPNGDLIHCVVPADYLIVAGVSNWGAYALAAGVFVVRGEAPPKGLFDPNMEKRILEIMVREGLVDGVTGKETPTVDGLEWKEYIEPFNRIRRILET